MDNLELRQAIADLKFEVRNFFADRNGKTWRWSCTICGDSRTNRTKARFYTSMKDGSAVCMCHNCGYANSFLGFLRSEFPSIYERYSVESFLNEAPPLYDINHLVERLDSEVLGPLFYMNKFDNPKVWLTFLQSKKVQLKEDNVKKLYQVFKSSK